MDGSQDHKISVKDILDLEFGDWRLLIAPVDVKEVEKSEESEQNVFADCKDGEHLLNEEMNESDADVDSN